MRTISSDFKLSWCEGFQPHNISIVNNPYKVPYLVKDRNTSIFISFRFALNMTDRYKEMLKVKLSKRNVLPFFTILLFLKVT